MWRTKKSIFKKVESSILFGHALVFININSSICAVDIAPTLYQGTLRHRYGMYDVLL